MKILDRTLDMLQNLANRMEMLVPIRLDIELDNVKIRDTFTWNLNGKPLFKKKQKDYNVQFGVLPS